MLFGGAALGVAAAMPAAAAVSPQSVDNASTLRIASLDYGLANSCIAMGAMPVGIANSAQWSRWVVEPALPPSVANLGSDLQINTEVLAALKPDLILATPYVSALRSRLEEIAPVATYAIYTGQGTPLANARSETRALGKAIGRARQADALIVRAEERFAQCASDLVGALQPKVLLVSFMDARHARVYGPESMFQNVLDAIGIENAWATPTNAWGFETVGIEDLARAASDDTMIVAIEPILDDVRPTLAHSPIWNRMPAVAEGRFRIMPSVLMFGMLPSAMRFARLLTAELLAGAPA